MGKISLWRIFMDYCRTLRNNATGGLHLPDVLCQIVLPLVGSLAYGVLRYLGMAPVGDGGVSDNIVTIVSIVSALLCGAAVMVFQLRVDIIGTEIEGNARRDELRVVDEIYADMLWAIVAGFAAAGALTVRGMFSWRVADCVLVSLATFFFVNFCLVVCMCLKRMSWAYDMVAHYWSRVGK